MLQRVFSVVWDDFVGAIRGVLGALRVFWVLQVVFRILWGVLEVL